MVLLLGDNLADFISLFDNKSLMVQRTSNVQQLVAWFGKKFIIFPNANDGGWENAIYGNSLNLNPLQKDSAIKNNLIDY